jgi:light-regulated signal transduction histidine kinase (bacteriophytochrome)
MPQPETKDEMIGFLMKRLQAAEEAISTCEEIIDRERTYRKQMSQDLKAKNRELRNIVDQEKASLDTKIEGKMARTLEAAVQDRMATQKRLT